MHYCVAIHRHCILSTETPFGGDDFAPISSLKSRRKPCQWRLRFFPDAYIHIYMRRIGTEKCWMNGGDGSEKSTHIDSQSAPQPKTHRKKTHKLPNEGKMTKTKPNYVSHRCSFFFVYIYIYESVCNRNNGSCRWIRGRSGIDEQWTSSKTSMPRHNQLLVDVLTMCGWRGQHTHHRDEQCWDLLGIDESKNRYFFTHIII